MFRLEPREGTVVVEGPVVAHRGTSMDLDLNQVPESFLRWDKERGNVWVSIWWRVLRRFGHFCNWLPLEVWLPNPHRLGHLGDCDITQNTGF